jgi:dethiobiotin synthetase
LFVTGTDTGVGKSVLSAAIVAALRAGGHAVRALKPLLTGLHEAPEPGGWPPDHELLALAAGCEPEHVVLRGFGPAVSPHLAAELAGERLAVDQLAVDIEAGAACAAPDAVLVVEGVGGLLVPLHDRLTVRDLARRVGLPVVIAARPGLGTINHTLLTLEAARAGGLAPLAVVLTPWPQRPDVIERSNLQTIERLGEVEVCLLPFVAEPAPDALAQAGARLPLARWLGLESIGSDRSRD